MSPTRRTRGPGLLLATALLAGCSADVPATGDGDGPSASSSGFTADDVRPATAAEACTRVPRSTLEALGLRAPRRAPTDCRWSGATSYGDAELTVDAEAFEPTPSMTAAEVAEAELPSLSGDDPRPVELGDEATITTTRAEPVGGDVLYGPPASTAVQLVTRAGNVVVVVSAVASGPLDGLPARPDAGRLEDVVVGTARDVLGAAGVGVPDVPDGADGPVAAPPSDVCPRSGALERLVPGGAARATDPPTGGRTAVCEVGPAGDPPSGARLTISVEAVDGSVDGTPAADVATGRLVTDEDSEPLEGVGDEALVRGSGQGTFLVAARRENVVVVVRCLDPSRRDTDDALVQDLATVARTALG